MLRTLFSWIDGPIVGRLTSTIAAGAAAWLTAHTILTPTDVAKVTDAVTVIVTTLGTYALAHGTILTASTKLGNTDAGK